MKKRRQWLGFLLLFLFPLAPCYAGWVITEKTTNTLGASSTQTTFIQNNKVRYESETSVAILDLNTKKVMMIFPQYKVYWEGSAESFRKSTMEAFDKHMQQVVVNAPAEDKEMYQKMYDNFKLQWKESVSDSLPFVVKTVPTGKSDTILKFPVKEYQVVVNDSVRESVWVTKAVNPYDEVDAHKMVDFTQSLNPFDEEAKITATKAYTDLIAEGMVLKSVEKHHGVQVATVVTQIRHVDFNNNIFNAPIGYRKADIAEILQMNPPNEHIDPNSIKMDQPLDDGSQK